jgi:uncharacterized protein (DUF1684 family)
MSELEIFRAAKDEFFGSHPQSPLTPEQKRNFDGLHYFPENPALRLEVRVDEDTEKDQLQIQTSSGDTQFYIRYGKFGFSANGLEVFLTIFTNEHGYFLPFVDSLAEKETYCAGRYLEPELLPDGKFRVDFNLAYNPYCAYNDLYSCPLTPRENRLMVPIEAGEKDYKTHY